MTFDHQNQMSSSWVQVKVWMIVPKLNIFQAVTSHSRKLDRETVHVLTQLGEISQIWLWLNSTSNIMRWNRNFLSYQSAESVVMSVVYAVPSWTTSNITHKVTVVSLQAQLAKYLLLWPLSWHFKSFCPWSGCGDWRGKPTSDATPARKH